ncbi:MAG: sulfite reductase subunit A [Planctomycetota bacterium]|nr:MAG: sulfite reductase subunit A [Planctomycetota bacterium]REJ96749.1 MAG: sulfite reductase subunit A [Planctomycetota bacterium]REK25159.1 MAG: sulfite reductase subunit A [Planctomycetota bacterium]REK38800.1 MAG: sulfite reductase subunit A [Planctomycetota bacterium]
MTAAAESTLNSETFLPRDGLQKLISHLSGDGFTVIGPKVDQGAIVYDEIENADELPRGWTDRQEPGRYRLERREDDAYFGFVVGPHSWKRFLFPPRATVATADRTENGWEMATPDEPAPRYAFLGVRACEIAAMKIQDRIFTGGSYVDPVYQRRRESAFIIAVNCTTAAATCFCVSMNTGPRCGSGFDLALTEIAEGFVIEVGSDAGSELLARLPVTPATDEQLSHADDERQQAVNQIQRTLNTDGIRDLLLNNLEHPQWSDVAKRCLSCTNCTMVCPTCFCSTVTEVSDLTGDHVERQRQWDSCFNIDFSYMNGGIVRDDVRSRYRQWLTHKLASWHDQFDSSGCVGCGRCITWCPTGIDLTAEVAAIRNAPRAKASVATETVTPQEGSA